jgi:hypothetical protein
MLLKDHSLPAVTAAVEQAAALRIYSYEGVRVGLGRFQDVYPSDPPPLVWPNRVDHFDQLVHG